MDLPFHFEATIVLTVILFIYPSRHENSIIHLLLFTLGQVTAIYLDRNIVHISQIGPSQYLSSYPLISSIKCVQTLVQGKIMYNIK